ncbi:MAG TPA: PfkB family carbohydrate kinase [Capsulimonadaceae bacterium]|jgi:rfaE bifunctional protein kinase chain/domain
MIDQQKLVTHALESVSKARVAVFGDFCLDAYWFVEDRDGEMSVETGLPIRHVAAQRYTPGGAGNVVANLAALGVGHITAIGAIGRDPFGDKLVALLDELAVDTSSIWRGQPDWQTCVYSKPYSGGMEQSRFDFGAFNAASPETIASVTAALEAAAATHDVLLVNQQIPNSICGDAIVTAINRIARAFPALHVVVDSRDRAGRFEGVTLKINAFEAAVLSGQTNASASEPVGIADVRRIASELNAATSRPVFVTRGERGLVVASQGVVSEVPGIETAPPIDPVGAGDTILSALSAVLATNTGDDAPLTAARVANIAATVILKKLHITGTASVDEITRAASTVEYTYLPELAVDSRAAIYIDGSEIELVRPLPETLAIKHAIFDHDGTLSTLREGWEKIMEPMMVKAILGRWYNTADEALFAKATRECREFIDRTTGIQTLVQMQGLVELVRQFGCVPEDEILDNHGYKRIYNDELLEMVKSRTRKLERGELSPTDFQLKNATALLHRLHANGVKLYLASGTDEADVIEEATAMGYADLFEGRIFGAVGDVNVEAKKLVLERIMRENSLSGPELVTFGDGPVEIRETRKRGGVTVGLASDEVRRFGLNLSKRKRLIRAGADLIVPDYSQLDKLFAVLNLK